MTVETKAAVGPQFMQEEIVQFVARALGVSPSLLNANSTVGDVPEWDSMGILAILTAIGREGIAFDPDNIMSFQSMAGVMEIFRKAGRLS